MPDSIVTAAGELLLDVCAFFKRAFAPILPSPEDKLRAICEESGDLAALRVLLEENPALLPHNGPTLHFSSSSGRRAGYTPLTLAARSGHYGVMCHLLQNQLCAAEERDQRWGATAAHHAARKVHDLAPLEKPPPPLCRLTSRHINPSFFLWRRQGAQLGPSGYSLIQPPAPTLDLSLTHLHPSPWTSPPPTNTPPLLRARTPPSC